MKTFQLTIARVGKTLYSGPAISAHFPGADGEFTILPNHEPFVSQLVAGKIRVKDEHNSEQTFESEKKGIVEVSNGHVTVLL